MSAHCKDGTFVVLSGNTITCSNGTTYIYSGTTLMGNGQYYPNISSIDAAFGIVVGLHGGKAY